MRHGTFEVDFRRRSGLAGNRQALLPVLTAVGTNLADNCRKLPGSDPELVGPRDC